MDNVMTTCKQYEDIKHNQADLKLQVETIVLIIVNYTIKTLSNKEFGASFSSKP